MQRWGPKVAPDRGSGDPCVGHEAQLQRSVLWLPKHPVINQRTQPWHRESSTCHAHRRCRSVPVKSYLLTRTVSKTYCHIYYFVLVFKISGHSWGGGWVCVSSRERIFLLGPFAQVLGKGWTLDHVWLFSWVLFSCHRLFSFETGCHPRMSPESLWKGSQGHQEVFGTFLNSSPPAEKIARGSLN